MKTLRTLLATAAALTVVTAARVAVACPNCSSAVAAQEDPVAAAAADGFQWSILFMIGSVFSVLGAVVFVIVRGVRHVDATDELL